MCMFYTKYNGITDWWWLVCYFAATCHLSQLPSMSYHAILFFMDDMIYLYFIFSVRTWNAYHFIICLFFSLIILMPARSSLTTLQQTSLHCILHKSCVDKPIIKVEKMAYSQIQSYACEQQELRLIETSKDPIQPNKRTQKVEWKTKLSQKKRGEQMANNNPFQEQPPRKGSVLKSSSVCS